MLEPHDVVRQPATTSAIESSSSTPYAFPEELAGEAVPICLVEAAGDGGRDTVVVVVDPVRRIVQRSILAFRVVRDAVMATEIGIANGASGH